MEIKTSHKQFRKIPIENFQGSTFSNIKNKEDTNHKDYKGILIYYVVQSDSKEKRKVNFSENYFLSDNQQFMNSKIMINLF
jgi:hypothetical protein